MDNLKNLLIISRANIQLGGTIPNASIGVLLGITHISKIDVNFLIYFLLYILLVSFSCHVNCYYDINVDKRYKKNLYNAVINLGKNNVLKLMIIEIGRYI